jgi:hypothetical protein
MRGNGRVFISHAHEDNDKCEPLITALDAWSVRYWFDRDQIRPGDHLGDQIQRAIADSDIFLRICTPAAQKSYWVRLETAAFRGLQAEGYGTAEESARVIVNVILDSAYEREPFDYATVYIDAASQLQRTWLAELKSALELGASANPGEGDTASSSNPLTDAIRPIEVGARHDADYRRIGDAIKAAQPGARIVIHPGTYNEALSPAEWTRMGQLERRRDPKGQYVSRGM